METNRLELGARSSPAALQEWQVEELRLETELCFRALAETAADAIVAIDENSRILYANPATERIFGHRVSELLNKDLTMLMPDGLRGTHHAAIQRYLNTGQRKMNWECVSLTGRHKKGTSRPLEVSFGEYQRNSHRFFTGFMTLPTGNAPFGACGCPRKNSAGRFAPARMRLQLPG